MFSKAEKKQMNIAFWDGFKQYMKSSKSSVLPRVNWLSYPTDLKHAYLRLFCDETTSALRFDIQLKDEDIRMLFWDQLIELKTLLNKTMNTETLWVKNIEVDGALISRIHWESNEWSLYNTKDWRKIYRYLKERLLEFDLFYQEYKEILINLIK